MKIIFAVIICVLANTAGAAPLKTTPTADTQLHYTIWGGGMHMVDADVDVKLTAKTYHGKVAAATRGWIGTMFPWWNRIETDGLVNGRDLLPQHYTATYSWKEKEKTTTLLFNKDGSFKDKQTVPVDTTPDPAQTATEMTKGAVDIISATLTVLLRLAQDERCDQTLTIYDGKRRFNLVFSEIQFEKFPQSQYSFYDGGARRCDLLMQTLAGQWRQNQFSWVTDPKGDMKLSIWMAPLVDGGIAVPVRARTYGEFGTLLIHLSSATYNGKTFAVPATD